MTRQRRVPALALLASVALLGGCGLLGDPDASTPTSESLTVIKVSVLPTSDQAPLYLGIKNGYFKEAGLDLKLITAASGGDSVSKLTSNEADIAYSSYPSFFTAQEKAGSQTPLRLIADATANAYGYTKLVVGGASRVKHLSDMTGARVAVTALGTMSHLATLALLRDNGIDWRSIQWVEKTFPGMGDLLVDNQVDAAYLVQPYVAKEAKRGVVPIFDAAESTKEMPLTGYGARLDFCEREGGELMRKFQRVMVRSTNEAIADPSKLEPIIQEYAKVESDVVKLAVPPLLQTSLDPNRIQRVPRLMRDFGYLKNDLDVSTMIVKPPVT